MTQPELEPTPARGGAAAFPWNRFAVILIWAVATAVFWRLPSLLLSASSILALGAAIAVRDRFLIVILAIASVLLVVVSVLITPA